MRAPEPEDDAFRQDLMPGERNGRAEDEGGPDERVAPAGRQIDREHDGQSDVRHDGRRNAEGRDGFAVERRADEHDEQRIGEEHQPLERGADVLQAGKVEGRGDVIADEADQRRPGRAGKVRRRLALGTALGIGPQADGDEERSGEDHAVGQEQRRVELILEGKLDEDGLGGEERGADRGTRIAHQAA